MSTSMDMHGEMSNCQFMTHEEVVCPMDLADHIGALKSVFLAAAPTLVLLLIVTSAVAFVASVAPHFLSPRGRPIPILNRQLRERTYSFSYRPFQELFSNGILHPKLF